MSEATIKVSDNDDGTINVHLDFNPPIDTDDQLLTNAQQAAVQFLSHLGHPVTPPE